MFQSIPHHRLLSVAVVSFPPQHQPTTNHSTKLTSSILSPSPPQTNTSLNPPPWLSQPSVRTALNVHSGGTWEQCASQGIFRNRTDGSLVAGDPYSPMPATSTLLSRMIEYTRNVIIGSGGLDMLVPTNGTLLVLQNVTWGGMQGFQRRPGEPVRFYILRSFVALALGIEDAAADDRLSTVLLALLERSSATLDGRHYRHMGPRTRTYILRSRSGRTRASPVSLPISCCKETCGYYNSFGLTATRYAPGPSFRAMELMLGRVSSLGDVGDFTTQGTASMDVDTGDLKA